MAEESGRLVAGAILLATIGIAGLVINLFIVVNMIRYRRNFGKHTILFMNVAVADLMMSLGAVTFRAPGILLRESFFDLSPVICTGSFFYLQFAYGASAWSLVLVTLDRFIAIIFPNSYNQYLSKSKTKLFLFLTWFLIPAMYATLVIVCSVSEPNLIIYDENLLRCSTNRTSSQFNLTRWSVLVVYCVPPSAIHIVCYGIMLYKLKSLPKMSAASYNLFKTGLYVFIGFTLSWLPTIVTDYATVWGLGEEGCKPALFCNDAWRGACIMLFYTSVVSNPIIYSLSLSKFREMLTKDMHKLEAKMEASVCENRAVLSSIKRFKTSSLVEPAIEDKSLS